MSFPGRANCIDFHAKLLKYCVLKSPKYKVVCSGRGLNTNWQAVGEDSIPVPTDTPSVPQKSWNHYCLRGRWWCLSLVGYYDGYII